MKTICLAWLLVGIALSPTTSFAADATNVPAIPYLTPEEEAKTFVYQDGYSLQLVLSDPIIKEPVLCVFDGNGRMFVAEMRSYMQDVDGKNEHARVSRISLHWSSKNNGVYDKHTVFADNLLLPRMILPLADGVLVNETDSEDLWLYRDTKGDGVADHKELFRTGGPRGGNLEHQPSGLIWDLDNWIYMAVNSYRLRIQGTNILQEPTAANNGQWGLCQDDYGKTWFVNAGYESGPLNFQTPIIYGGFQYVEKLEFRDDFGAVWPLVGLADVQGGTVRFRPEDKTLNHFTGTCGEEIYRGDRLPADLRGDLLFCEPVGRLIRRSKVEVEEAFTWLRNPYEKSEFIRSTDPNFRPINLANAPDGSLYVVDMYRGVIQESAWVNPGSYLRPVVQKYQLDKNIGRGRIWRLVNKKFKPGPAPHMLDEKPAQWVKHLENPNGWWRDTAQKLLVLRGDKSVAPALIKMARDNANHLARIHALWTLEGLDALSDAIVHTALVDRHPQVRIAGIRVSESLYKKGDHSLVPDICALTNDLDSSVVLQAILTANYLKWPNYGEFIRATVAGNPAHGIQVMGGQISPGAVATGKAKPAPPAGPPLPALEAKLMANGEIIYQQLCFACHGPDGKGAPVSGAPAGVTTAPPLGGSRTATGYRDGIICVVLKGLAGPVNGSNYTAQMVAMQSNDDAWIAAVTSYIRNSFGNHSSFITTNDVARVRAAIKNRADPWTLDELMSSLPQPLTNRQQWKLTASNNRASAPLAVDGNPATRYDTRTPQVPGMWFQIDLRRKTTVLGLELDAGSSTLDYPRGYKVELSLDGEKWGEPVATGRGTGALTEIAFPPAQTQFIRITQTGSDPGLFWSIHELQVLTPPPPIPKLTAKPATPTPASTLPPSPATLPPIPQKPAVE